MVAMMIEAVMVALVEADPHILAMLAYVTARNGR
jgi:hypothetical protein